jgi:flagellar FliL protein
MPPAVAAPVDAAPPEAPKRKLLSKKLLLVLLGVVLLLAVAGGAAVVVLKKRAAAAAEAAEAGAEEPAGHAERSKIAPTYVPLDPFTVNLADKDAERFAQIGVTFELDDPHAVDEVKNYMPSIRNAILLLLAHKTAAELLGRPGKELLAREIGREATRAMGYDVPAEVEPPVAADEPASGAAGEAIPKRPARKAEPVGPIRHVHFANFIIQ